MKWRTENALKCAREEAHFIERQNRNNIFLLGVSDARVGVLNAYFIVKFFSFQAYFSIDKNVLFFFFEHKMHRLIHSFVILFRVLHIDQLIKYWNETECRFVSFNCGLIGDYAWLFVY